MTVELTPLGVACNLSCTYCYQHPMRDAGNVGAGEYDLVKMTSALERTGQEFTVFGGEPLLVPLADLEHIWKFGLERYGKNGVQTNGALITDAHVELFRRYKVHVGFSMDGPGELNDSRWAGSLEKTREATKRSQEALERLLAEGLGVSLIVTLHRMNAGTRELRDRLKAWLTDLDSRGLTSSRLHILEIDHPLVRKRLELSEAENIDVFLEFAAFERTLPRLRFDVFRDVEAGLLGSEDVTCTWSSCDPYTTQAVHGVNGQGELSNCGRTNKDGVAWLKATTVSRERQLALYNTPQQYGGCKGCRFFLMCRGQCPGTGIGSDWRNRSENCAVWMAMFEFKEAELVAAGKQPISLAPQRTQLEQQLLDAALGGGGEGNHPHVDQWTHGDKHGDHTDITGATVPDEAQSDHGDKHGDSPHGDHTDMARQLLAVVPVVRRES